MALTDDRTTLNDMDTQTDIDGWTTPSFDAMGLNDTNQPSRLYREGGACGQMVVKSGTSSYWYDDVAFSIDGGIRADKLLVMWLLFFTPATVTILDDILVGMYDGTGGQGGSGIGGRWRQDLLMTEADHYGWWPAAIYPTQPDETKGTFTSMVKGSMDSIELDVGNSGGTDVKLAGMEASFTISYIGGHSQTVTLVNLVDHSKDKTNDRDFGVAFSTGDAFRFRVCLRLGDAAATATTTFSETAKVIHFDNVNTDHEIGIDFINDPGGDLLNFTLTGCFLFWNDGASDVFVGPNNVDSWSVTGNTFLRSGPVELPTHATGYETNANVFDSCGEVDIGDAVFEGNTVSNATSGVLYSGTGTRRSKDNIYSNNTDALHFDTAQTITLDGDTFSGNTDDIHFSGTGTLTINLINGANPTTSRVSGGGTVVINQPAVTLTINVDDNAGVDLQNARVLAEAADGTGDLPFEESVTITRSGSTASVSHTSHGMVAGDKVVIRGANQQEYNGVFAITNITTNAYDYTVSGTPTTPATGTITATGAVLEGLTDVNGQITRSRAFGADQPIRGFIRRSTTSALFKPFSLAGNVIDSGSGLTVAIRMQLDE